MAIKVLPLKGIKSVSAMHGLSALLMGLKMLPDFMAVTYVDFYESFKEMDEPKKESLIRQAVAFVELKKEEIESLASFCTDVNGIPYSPVNISNLGLKDLHEIIVAVAMEIGRVNISLLSEGEKKKYLNSQSTLDEALSNDLTVH